MSVAQAGLFRARWTEQIHDEWTRNLAAKRPDIADKLTHTRNQMNEAVLDCLITGYEPLINCLDLPDEDDRHVLAAAIVGRASVIVNYNLKDFPPEILKPFGIHAEHPDQFISYLFDLAPPMVAAQVKTLRTRLKNPPVTVDELLERYLQAGLPETASDLATMKDLL